MRYRRLGRSGLMASELTLGTMNLGGPTDESTSLHMIDKALDTASIFWIVPMSMQKAGVKKSWGRL